MAKLDTRTQPFVIAFSLPLIPVLAYTKTGIAAMEKENQMFQKRIVS